MIQYLRVLLLQMTQVWVPEPMVGGSQHILKKKKKSLEKRYLILGVYLQILSPEIVTPMFCYETRMFVILVSFSGDEPQTR